MSVELLRQQAEQLAAEAQAEAALLEEQRDALDAQIKEMRKIARGFVTAFVTPTGSSGTGKKRERLVSPARALDAAQAVLELGKEQFTPQEVGAHMGFTNPSSARECMDTLRQMEFLGYGKRERREGKTSGMPTQHFRVIHPKPEQFIAELKRNAQS